MSDKTPMSFEDATTGNALLFTQQAARIRELEGLLGVTEKAGGDGTLAYVKRLVVMNNNLSQQVADLTAACALLQEIITHGHDEQWDATDAACACWWRGDDHGAVKVAEMVISWSGIPEDLKRRLLPIVKLSGNISMPLATAAQDDAEATGRDADATLTAGEPDEKSGIQP